MKNKYDDALQEAFLKSAFEEAARQDIAELEAMKVEVRYPTEKQKREIQREIRKVERGSSRGFSRLGRAVAMIAIVLCITFGAIMVQPTVRASVWDVVVSFFEKYLSFDFDKNEIEYAYQMGDYKVTYIPKGFNLEETQVNPLRASLMFVRDEEVIRITAYHTPLNMTAADDEQVKYETLKIDETNGYIVRYDDREEIHLAWGNDTSSFVIIANIAESEIIKIAKNIK